MVVSAVLLPSASFCPGLRPLVSSPRHSRRNTQQASSEWRPDLQHLAHIWPRPSDLGNATSSLRYKMEWTTSCATMCKDKTQKFKNQTQRIYLTRNQLGKTEPTAPPGVGGTACTTAPSG